MEYKNYLIKYFKCIIFMGAFFVVGALLADDNLDIKVNDIDQAAHEILTSFLSAYNTNDDNQEQEVEKPEKQEKPEKVAEAEREKLVAILEKLLYPYPENSPLGEKEMVALIKNEKKRALDLEEGVGMPDVTLDDSKGIMALQKDLLPKLADSRSIKEVGTTITANIHGQIKDMMVNKRGVGTTGIIDPKHPSPWKDWWDKLSLEDKEEFLLGMEERFGKDENLKSLVDQYLLKQLMKETKDNKISKEGVKAVINLIIALANYYGKSVFGTDTFMHELLGHLYMGGGMVYNYPEGNKVVWDNGLGNEHNLSIDAFLRLKDGNLWDILTLKDVNDIGSSGYCYTGMYADGASTVGEQLGFFQSNAWVSLTGILPGKIKNFVQAFIGAQLIKANHPWLGFQFLGSAFLGDLDAVSYYNTKSDEPGMDPQMFSENYALAKGGDKEQIFKTTQALVTLSLPIVMLTTMLRANSSLENAIPESVATIQFYKKVLAGGEKSKEYALLRSYPGIDKLRKIQEQLSNKVPISPVAVEQELSAFQNYLHLKKYDFQQLKQEALVEYDPKQAPVKVKGSGGWNFIKLIGNGLHYASPIIKGVAINTGSKVARVFSKVGSIFGLVSAPVEVMDSGIQLVRNLQSTRLNGGEKIAETAINVVELASLAGVVGLNSSWADVVMNDNVDDMTELMGGYQFLATTCLYGLTGICKYTKKLLLSRRVNRDLGKK